MKRTPSPSGPLPSGPTPDSPRSTPRRTRWRLWQIPLLWLPACLLGTALSAQPRPPTPCLQAARPPAHLADLLDEALCADTRTRQAWQQLQLQSARLEGQLASARPELALRLETGRESGALAASNSRSRTATLELGWLLFDGGRQEAATRGARLAVTEAMAQRDSAFQSVLLDTAQAYHAVLDAQQAVQARQALLDALAALHPTVQQRHRAGKAEHTELLELRQARARNQIGQRDAALALAVARARLSSLTGRAPDAAWPVFAATSALEPDSSTFGALATADALNATERTLAQALDQHPELAAARARAGAARAALDQSERAGRPTVGLSHSLGRGRRTGDGAPVSGSARQTTLALSWPLFDGGVRQAQRQAARVEHEAALTALDDQRQRLATGVWETYQEWRTAAAQLAEYQDLVRLARGLLSAELARHQSGDEEASLADLLSVHQDWTDALIEQQQARSRQRLSSWRLAAGLGRLERDALRPAQPLATGTGMGTPPPVVRPPAPAPGPSTANGCQPGAFAPGEAWCVPR
jgi:outer membrane protein